MSQQASSTTVAPRPPETNAGITTSWLPMSTAWESGYPSDWYMWNPTQTNLVAWDPDLGPLCQPPQVVSWWKSTSEVGKRLSIGPVVCPEAYSTAASSVNQLGNTFVACCPSEYIFVDIYAAGVVGECVSTLDEGQVVTLVTPIEQGWIGTTLTVLSPSLAFAVHVNGWLFPPSTSTRTIATTIFQTAFQMTSQVTPQTPSTNHTDLSPSPPVTTPTSSVPSQPPSGLSKAAKVGIGVGLPLGAVAIGALVLVLILYRRMRAATGKPLAAPLGDDVQGGGIQPNLDDCPVEKFELPGGEGAGGVERAELAVSERVAELPGHDED